MQHVSVLLDDVVNNLNLQEDGVYVDATLGYAGHSKEILSRLRRGFLFAFDQDADAVLASTKTLSSISSNFKIIPRNFVYMKEELLKENINEVDGIIFDLGFSSPQVDNPLRGFSFMKDGPLDMRMNQFQELDAAFIVNNYAKEELINLIYQYGEEKKARYIAQEITSKRKKNPITTTKELVEIIKEAVGAKYFNNNHPERQIFQALRIAVNDELKVLETILPIAIKMLKKGGRICVITFHSLEDKIVKHIFKEFSEVNEVFKGLPDIPKEYLPLIKIINKKPIVPSLTEIENNPRSKSAKLRIIERI